MEQPEQQPTEEEQQAMQEQTEEIKRRREMGSDQRENDPRGNAIEGGSTPITESTAASESNPPASDESVGEGSPPAGAPPAP